MAKVRVSELAKEFGVSSNEVIEELKGLGEYVKSPSATVEEIVVADLRRTMAKKAPAAPPPAAASPTAPASAAGAGDVEGASKPKPATKAKPGGKKASDAEPTETAVADSQAPATPPVAPVAPAGPTAPVPPQAQAPSAPAAPTFTHPTTSDVSHPQPGGSTGPRVGGPSAPGAPAGSRPGGTGRPQTPGASGPSGPRRPGTPRPGNNPYAQKQGMGYGERAPRTDDDGTRPPRPAGVPGMPRPNPLLMPKRVNPGIATNTGTGGPRVGGRPGQGGPRTGQGGPGRGGPGGGGPGGGYRGGQGGPGGPGGSPGGAPGMGGGTGGPGRAGRGGRGGAGTQGAFGRGGAPGKRGKKSKRLKRQEWEEIQQAPAVGGIRVRHGDGEEVRLRRGSSLTDLGEKINIDAAQLVSILFNLGEMITATQSVPDETLEVLGAELNYHIVVVSPEDEDRELLESFDLAYGEDIGDESDLVIRPPVVTVMGHVDHGKTKLLDTLRHTNVVAKEAGGITQAIGAYQVETVVAGEPRLITFIDTPGHEAFTQMRARGAQSTDIAVLVVAADDGVKPQTIEALNHALAAEVPIVVAVNKTDLEAADPTKVRGQLMEYGLTPEEYGGETQFIDVSAKTGDGLDSLLEAIILTADAALDLRANPSMPAQGVSIEAHLDQGRGATATVLIQRGTLRKGDSIVAGSTYGRVRAMINDHGEQVDEAPPSMPVQVLGLSAVPGAGDHFLVVDDDRVARQFADKRAARMRAAAQALGSRRRTLEEMFEQLNKGVHSELLLILKGDAAGAVEALEASLAQIDVGDEVSLRVIDRGVGAITETNVTLAAASEPHAVIIGFNVRPTVQAARLADRENVDIRFYNIVYNAIDDIQAALKGMLKPIYEEKTLGVAEIREIFKSSKVGNIAGCMIIDGIVRRNAKCRLLREGAVIAETTISSLRREKDDATEVREGYECGLTLNNVNDIHVGDQVEVYEMVEKPRE